MGGEEGDGDVCYGTGGDDIADDSGSGMDGVEVS